MPPPAPPPPPPPAYTAPPEALPPRPRIAVFEAEPSRIQRGQTLTLRWAVSGDVTDIRIEPDVGTVNASGSRQVFPESNTTYELLVRGPVGEARQTASVTVDPGPTAAPSPPVTSRGTIQGSATDATGAAIAGATVTAIGNGAEARVMTDARGQFVFRNVPPGTYQIEITTGGFRKKRIENVVVSPGQSISLTPVMELDNTTAAVAVSGPGSRFGSGSEGSAAHERLVIRIGDIPPPAPASSAVGAAYNRLPVGAYRFELPELRQHEKSVARLLVDANPLQVRTEDEWTRAVARAGHLAGQPTKISDLMAAGLSASEGVAIRPLDHSGDGQQSVFAGRLTKWNWEVTPPAHGTQVITVDLRAKLGEGYERVAPFPIVQQRTVIPSAEPKPADESAAGGNHKRTSSGGIPWSWLLGVLLAIAGTAGVLLWRRRRSVSAVAVPAAGVVHPRVLIIHGMDERSQAERFCKRLGVSRCEYIYVVSGYPVGSPQWQQVFSRELAQADAVIVLLTGAALGEQWVNWQVEKAIRQQSGRGTPIYPVILDEKVSRAASTLERLSAFAWLSGNREQDVDELKERVAAIEPAPTRLVRCFLSYSRKTQQEIDTAVRLEADLEQMGYQCFRDLTDLRGGEEWERVIRGQLAQATHLLVLVTQSSTASRWVLKEILWAEGKTIIPLMAEGVELPEELRRYQGIPFSNYETGLTALLQALQKYQPTGKEAGAA